MSDERLAAYAQRPSSDFWQDLKRGYDSFERTHRPPEVSICEGRYRIEDGAPKPVAEENSEDKKSSRTRSVAGAVREAYPEPVVAAAASRGGPQSDYMSKLGGPVDAATSASAPAGRDASAR
jgi:murein L,D-transpeptidase YafK